MTGSLTKWTGGVLLTILLILTLVPFVLLIFFSFKTQLEVLIDFWGMPDKLHFENYSAAWKAVRSSIGNSLYVCVITVAGAVLIGSLSGYVFARHKFPLKSPLYMLLIGVMMIPSLLTVVPLYAIITNLHMTHSFWGLILPYISGTQLLGIMLCRTLFESLPEELFEAARIDGGSEFYLYSRIALPLCVPILVTIGIVTFLAVYSDYLWPFIVLDQSQQTFTMAAVGLNKSGRSDIGLSFAAYIIGSVPTVLVILFGMKYYIEGMVSGAVKS
ncbi:carbohydrate ABC transporter permease [Paenibacillus sacheonensis]|uniref:ABC transporter permease subunit n=1 Tax=Paenibacillus sacheonensis TaxID=742054 RepID=A0A7X4YMU7_9BACL|nr:carbohydrate ABC transporter permease [Paenibacillus sacheonensis]MBM7568351.1 ABC-type glycerol-3-phosphate transport system permease component [Paenibacillus sacheonensis]NBC68466.1 ABC transporter permease subunit [Paenibacillus sacheonensis]